MSLLLVKQLLANYSIPVITYSQHRTASFSIKAQSKKNTQ